MVIPPAGDATDGDWRSELSNTLSTVSELFRDFGEEIASIVNGEIEAIMAFFEQATALAKPVQHYAKAIEQPQFPVVFVSDVRCRGPTSRTT